MAINKGIVGKNSHHYCGQQAEGCVFSYGDVYDDPVLNSFGYGLATPVEGCCSIAGETRAIKNLVQRHACDCKIKFW